MRLQGVLFDNYLIPNTSKQLVFGHELSSMLDKCEQQVERMRTQVHGRAAVEQAPLIRL